MRDHDRGVRFRGACGRAEARAGAVEGQENGCPEKGRRGGRRLRYGVRHAGKKIEKKERVKTVLFYCIAKRPARGSIREARRCR